MADFNPDQWARIRNKIKTEEFYGNIVSRKPIPGIILFDKKKWDSIGMKIDAKNDVVNFISKVFKICEQKAKNCESIELDFLIAYAGFEIGLIEFEDSKAGTILTDGDEKIILINERYDDDNQKFDHTICYLLAYYYYSKKKHPEKDICYDLYEKQLNKTISKNKLEYFTREMLSKDAYLQENYNDEFTE